MVQSTKTDANGIFTSTELYKSGAEINLSVSKAGSVTKVFPTFKISYIESSNSQNIELKSSNVSLYYNIRA